MATPSGARETPTGRSRLAGGEPPLYDRVVGHTSRSASSTISTRQEDPTQDELLKDVWTGRERSLLERLHNVRQIVCPNWEPIYEGAPPLWQQFLQERGYTQGNRHALGKSV